MGKKLTKRQEETLKTMKKTRKEDSIFLRNIFEEKLEWAKKEKAYGLQKLKDLEVAKSIIQKQVIGLDACIGMIDQVLFPKDLEKPQDDIKKSE